LTYLRSELGLPAPLALRFAFELNALAAATEKAGTAGLDGSARAQLQASEEDDHGDELLEVDHLPSPTRRAAARDAVIGGFGHGGSHSLGGNGSNPGGGGNGHGGSEPPGGGEVAAEAGRGAAADRPAPSSPRLPRSAVAPPSSAARALFRGGDGY
jgi:hypothetical protein